MSNYRNAARKWTKHALVDLKKDPDDIDLGYTARTLGVHRWTDDDGINCVSFYDADAIKVEGERDAWLAVPDHIVIDNVAMCQ